MMNLISLPKSFLHSADFDNSMAKKAYEQGYRDLLGFFGEFL